MADELRNPKQIPDPDNEGQMIDNPDYDPDFNEDGTKIEDKDKKDDKSPDDDKVKKNLAKAYEERDAARREAEQLRKEKREAELARLKEEGKEKEHYEGRISDLEKENTSLKQQVVELTRDNSVQQALSGYTFRNERAAKTAQRDIVSELVQNDKGEWVHRSGKTIQEFTKQFSEDEDNAFLFKAKENRGTQTPPTKPNGGKQPGGKLADRSQADFLKDIAEGRFKPS